MTPPVFGLVNAALKAARRGERLDTDRIRGHIAAIEREGDRHAARAEADGRTMPDGYAAARTSLVLYGEALDLIDAGDLDQAEQVWRRATKVAGR